MISYQDMLNKIDTIQSDIDKLNKSRDNYKRLSSLGIGYIAADIVIFVVSKIY